MLPSAISCRRCAAQPGEPCVDSLLFHAERVEDAASIDVQGANVSVEDFDKSVNDSGLV